MRDSGGYLLPKMARIPALLALLATAASQSGCGPTCANDQVKIVEGPEGAAVLFRRNCGATTSYSFIVGIYDESPPFDLEDRKHWILTMENGSNTELKWSAPTTLLISGLPEERFVFERKSHVNQFSVIYEE